jgi:hypothetical protein
VKGGEVQMKKKHRFLKPFFALLLFFAFSMLVFGCGNKGESRGQTKKVEGKQLMEGSSAYIKEVTVACLSETHRHEVNASDSEVVQFLSPVWHKELARAFCFVF